MQLKNDNRGVSEVIGAILVFGLLVALMAIIQTQAIPAANQEVEFNHNQEVQGDLVKFHQKSYEVANQGATDSVSIQAGHGYPTRLLFFNPPRTAGKVSTSQRETVEIRNIAATDSETNDYIQVDQGGDLELDSRTMQYEVRYSEFRDAPTIRYEYGLLYNDFGDAATTQNPGSIIDDTDINLIFMRGNYSRSSTSAQSLDVRPVSAPARPVTIKSDGSDPIEIELPSRLPEEEWEALYNQSTVEDITKPDDDTVIITLDGSETYTLRMAGLGLQQGVEKPEPYYIVPAGDGVETVGAEQDTTAVYEVRDRYNNPVNGVKVDIDRPGSSVVTRETDGQGRVSASVSSSTGGTLDVPAEINTTTTDCTTSEDRCSATFKVQVADISINPTSGVVFQEASTGSTDIFSSLLGLGSSTLGVETTFQADGSTDIGIEKVRINHYQRDDGDQPTEWAMSDGSTEITGDVAGDFEDASSLTDVSTGGTQYMFDFKDGSDVQDADSSDFFVVTMTFDNGQRSTYFVSPDDS